jgi:hypothetical protein
MDLIVAVLVLLASAIGSVLANIISNELYDRCHLLSHWLIKQAANRLPPSLRGRYYEEWCAHLSEAPSQFAKIWHAIGCLRSAPAIAKSETISTNSGYLVISLRAARSECVWISASRRLKLKDLRWLYRTSWKLLCQKEFRICLSIERRALNETATRVPITRDFMSIDVDPDRPVKAIELLPPE